MQHDPIDPRDAEPIALDHRLFVQPQPPIAFEGLRTAENRLSRLALIAALALLSWMLIGIALAWHAGRL